MVDPGNDEGFTGTGGDARPMPEPGTRRARKKAITRDQILTAATRLFWERGYDATSIHDITEAADVAFRTFYLHFATKADVAIARFEEWLHDLMAALQERPEEERPDAMLAAAFEKLAAKGYAGSLRTADGQPVAPVPFAVMLAETAPEVAGRMFQAMTRTHQEMTAMFGRRLGFPPGAQEPRIVAASYFATFIVTAYGYSEVLASDPHPEPSNAYALRAIAAYVDGVGRIVDNAPATLDRPDPR